MTASDRHLAGKVAWVTGSSRGIGRSILVQLAHAGATVVLHGTHPESPRSFNEGTSLEAAAQDISKSHRVDCLPVQLRSFSINVNAVAPGDIVTERWKASRTYETEKMVPDGTLDRYGQPREIAEVVEFLASPQSSYISGQIIRVDGCMQAWPA